MIIRWLGAFGAKGSLANCLDWELTLSDREVCAEPCGKDGQDFRVRHARIGLVVTRQAVRRVAKGDVWSEPNRDGYLRPTRRPRSTHGEAFCLPIYSAIIFHGRIFMDEHYQAMIDAAKKYNLPVLKILKNGKTKEVYRP